MADANFELSGQHWHWGNRQKPGAVTFAQPLSCKATHLAHFADLLTLTEKMVGVA